MNYSKLIKITILFIIFSFFLSFSVYSDQYSFQVNSTITCEVHENDEFRVRLYFSYENLIFYIIDESKGVENNDVTIGLSTERISFGPMYIYGLFKEISNPLGYTPKSGIFSEKSDLRLKSGFESGLKRFLDVHLIPDFCNLFFQTGKDVPPFFGTHLSINVMDILLTDFIGSVSIPFENEEDTWFYDVYHFPGGNLYHLSLKNRLKIRNFLLSLSASVSLGDIVIPGFFINNYISWELGWCTPSILFGYCSEGYVTPGGIYKEKMIRAGSALEVSPVSGCTIDIQYWIDIDHPLPFPQKYIGTENICITTLSYACKLANDLDLTMSCIGEASLLFSPEGTKEEEQELTFSSGVSSSFISASTAFSIHNNKDQKIIPEWKINLSFNSGLHYFKFQSILTNEENFSWKGNIQYKIKKETICAWSSISLKKPVTLTNAGISGLSDSPFSFILFSFGFETMSL